MAAVNPLLQRQTFAVARASEYFVASELQAQTGQPVERFAAVAVKELLDNALDAAESAGVRPAVTLEVHRRPAALDLTVTDNGPGLPAATVASILDFTTRTSDKAAYRSPTRGAQGNALKTILGLPHALGGRAPVEIEACGVHHAIRAWVDPAGEVRVEHTQNARPTRPGTRVALTLPDGGQVLTPAWWVSAFAVFNPHTAVRITESWQSSDHGQSPVVETDDFYQAVIPYPAGWHKWRPTDPTSPHWYDGQAFRRLVFLHIAAACRGAGPDLTLREFVRQFRGLTATAKAAAICAQFPTLRRLSDCEGQETAVDRLLVAMQQAATPPAPAVLGLVSEAALRARVETWYGILPGQWWYAKSAGLTPANLPFVIEAAVAQTCEPGNVFLGLNFSPAYGDPYARVPLAGGEVQTYGGVYPFLARCGIDPRDDACPPMAAIVHLVCPALQFLDRGKTQLQLPPSIAESVGEALWRVGKVCWREARARERDARAAERRAEQRWRADQRPKMSLLEACFLEMTNALAHASGNGRYSISTKDLHYAIRPMIQRYTDATLTYKYFSQQVVTAYRQQVGELPGVFYDPVGELIEPHTGLVVPLGTRGVQEYVFPAWRYDTIVYIEKKGRAQMLREAGLLGRFDIAVISAEGYATEAARVLLQHADQQKRYKIFALHDADPYGYNIARTLRDATSRMPEHHVDVIDLGLRLEPALALGLQLEGFTRKAPLPAEVERQLTDVERTAFLGRLVGNTAAGTPQYACQRIELNALTAPQFVAYIEEQLTAHGADQKVIPPSEELDAEAARHYARQLSRHVEAVLDELLDVPALQQAVQDTLRESVLWRRVDPAALVGRFLQGHRALPWDAVVHRRVDTRLGRQEIALRDKTRETLEARIAALADREAAGDPAQAHGDGA
jgi:hypothetical protein